MAETIQKTVKIDEHLEKCSKIGEEIGQTLTEPEDLLMEINGKIAIGVAIGTSSDFQPAMTVQTLRALELHVDMIKQRMAGFMDDPDVSQGAKDILEKIMDENQIVVEPKS